MQRLPKVRIERIEVSDPRFTDEYKFIEIDTDGDVYLCDGSGDAAFRMLIRRHMVPAVSRALRIAVQVSE